jgi:hypothetical protein
MMSKAPERKSHRGSISDEVKQWILKNKSAITADEMAKQLKLKPATVQKIIDTFGGLQNKNAMWRERLRRSVIWKQIREELNDVEIEFFVEKYMQLMEQFKDDVMATEEQQVFNIIRIEVLMHRNMAGKKSLRQGIERLERHSEELLQAHGNSIAGMDVETRDQWDTLIENISDAHKAEQSKTGEYTNLQKEHNALTEGLKATRDQRLDRASTSKKSWTELVKDLLQRDVQEKETRQLELYKLALNEETKRLGTPFRFQDNTMDLPYLSPETIEMLDKEEQEEDENIQP